MIVIVLIQIKIICTKVINITNINFCHHMSTIVGKLLNYDQF